MGGWEDGLMDGLMGHRPHLQRIGTQHNVLPPMAARALQQTPDARALASFAPDRLIIEHEIRHPHALNHRLDHRDSTRCTAAPGNTPRRSAGMRATLAHARPDDTSLRGTTGA